MEINYIQLALGIFSAMVSGLVSFIWWKIKKLDERREEALQKQREEHERAEENLKNEILSLKEGTLSLLRNELVETMTACEEIGFKRIYQIDNVTHMMKAYKSLGGNGVTESLFKEFKELPTGSGVKRNEKP
ncbi:MAG: hypothetical protein J6O04_01495 [Selenomonadaceae bacterium]|nr:hypothetical protein [Selenomonadaceae bacterium]